MSIPKSSAVNISRPVYAMASVDGNSAEVTMYGDIYEQQPTDWWTGKPIEGQFILLSDFLNDLEKIAHCKEITIRMNSYGGDAGVSNTIHNRLRELSRKGAKLTCIVDGVAMSGGSLIMCACDNVQVNPSSLIMIHKCWSFIWGSYNADELRQQAEQNDAWDKMQVSIYKRKTGLSDTILTHMMADTTYMTGHEAVEKKFADELLEDAEPLNITASADGRCLFVRGRQMHLDPGTFAPDHIPTVTPEGKASVEANKNMPVVTGSEEGGNSMTEQELRAQYPDIVAQVEAKARASGNTDAINAAVQAERDRIREIDEVAGLYSEEMVREAKYGDTACTAQQLTYNAAKAAAAKGAQVIKDLEADASTSGAPNVGATPPTTDGGEEITVDHAKAAAKAFNARKKEGR